MRILPERANHDGEGAAGQNPHPTDAQIRESHERHAVPLHEITPAFRRPSRRARQGCVA